MQSTAHRDLHDQNSTNHTEYQFTTSFIFDSDPLKFTRLLSFHDLLKHIPLVIQEKWKPKIYGCMDATLRNALDKKRDSAMLTEIIQQMEEELITQHDFTQLKHDIVVQSHLIQLWANVDIEYALHCAIYSQHFNTKTLQILIKLLCASARSLNVRDLANGKTYWPFVKCIWNQILQNDAVFYAVANDPSVLSYSLLALAPRDTELDTAMKLFDYALNNKHPLHFKSLCAFARMLGRIDTQRKHWDYIIYIWSFGRNQGYAYDDGCDFAIFKNVSSFIGYEKYNLHKYMASYPVDMRESVRHLLSGYDLPDPEPHPQATKHHKQRGRYDPRYRYGRRGHRYL